MSFGNEIRDFVAAFQVGAGAVNNRREMDGKLKLMSAQADYYAAHAKYYENGGAKGGAAQEAADARKQGEDDWAHRGIGGVGGGTAGDRQKNYGANATHTVNDTLPAEARALLDTIAGTEARGYNIMYSPDRPRMFNDYSAHPHSAATIKTGPNAGKKSDAAGRYQFLGSTWDPIAKKLGLKDFSPESQDTAAWYLAQEAYKEKTGGNLLEALQSGKDMASVGKALAGKWTSLPGGIEQGQGGKQFAGAFTANFNYYRDAAAGGGGKVDVASGPPTGSGALSTSDMADLTKGGGRPTAAIGPSPALMEVAKDLPPMEDSLADNAATGFGSKAPKTPSALPIKAAVAAPTFAAPAAVGGDMPAANQQKFVKDMVYRWQVAKKTDPAQAAQLENMMISQGIDPSKFPDATSVAALPTGGQ